MSIRYPYSRQEITEEDRLAVSDSLMKPLLTQGPKIEAFEAALAEKLRVKHVVVCNSGTAALHLAYLALGLGPERGLLTTPLTFLATANAARMCGAPVVFMDTDQDTGNATVEHISSALESENAPLAAISVVHLGGRACDMPAIRRIAAGRGLALVEDASHAPLAGYSDERGTRFHVGACAHSDIATFSFHPIKHIAMGEGGALTTNDDLLAGRARLYRNHGMTRDSSNWQQAPEADAPWYYEMHDVGWNYRACEMQCALGLSQLSRLDGSISRRREIAETYHRLLSGLNHVRPAMPDPGHVWHLYPVAIDFDAVGKSRGQVMRELAARGVGTQVHYIPVNGQPYYKAMCGRHTPNADFYYRHTLSIPMYPGLSDQDTKNVADALCAVLNG